MLDCTVTLRAVIRSSAMNLLGICSSLGSHSLLLVLCFSQCEITLSSVLLLSSFSEALMIRHSLTKGHLGHGHALNVAPRLSAERKDGYLAGGLCMSHLSSYFKVNDFLEY